jgi:hypothetical protein
MITKFTALGKSSIWKITTTGVRDTTQFDGILDDPTLKKVMSASDMYLTKFEDHDWSFLQAGTLVSLYNQCMGLLGTFSIYTLHFTCQRWVFVDQVANQIDRIYEQPDELRSMTSYI